MKSSCQPTDYQLITSDLTFKIVFTVAYHQTITSIREKNETKQGKTCTDLVKHTSNPSFQIAAASFLAEADGITGTVPV